MRWQLRETIAQNLGQMKHIESNTKQAEKRWAEFWHVLPHILANVIPSTLLITNVERDCRLKYGDADMLLHSRLISVRTLNIWEWREKFSVNVYK